MKRATLFLWMLTGCLAIGGSAFAQSTNAPGPLDLKFFEIISQRNIFNPNRTGRRPLNSSRPPRVDAFTLVGTMSYGKGSFAFFEGSSSQYRRTLKLGDSIAGYKIGTIGEDSIQLVAASNLTVNLPVGTQMKRTEGSHWTVAGRAQPSDYSEEPAASVASPSSPSAPAAPPSGAQSDVMKRLMANRLNEK